MKSKNNTSWGKAADWYDHLLKDDKAYQKQVILPNLLRQINLKKGEVILDLACGQGFFSREFYKAGAKVFASDIAKELIDIAIKNSPKEIAYYVSSADDISFLKDKTVDKIVCILAIQNIENASGVLKECARVLRPNGELNLVLNHPAFRNPQASKWGWDDKNKIQYRRVDKYLSESKIKIQTRPGSNPSDFTISFHRPLQYYFKALGKNNFGVIAMEEWISHRKTTASPRQEAENKARTEIPLFMFLKAKKM